MTYAWISRTERNTKLKVNEEEENNRDKSRNQWITKQTYNRIK